MDELCGERVAALSQRSSIASHDMSGLHGHSPTSGLHGHSPTSASALHLACLGLTDQQQQQAALSAGMAAGLAASHLGGGVGGGVGGGGGYHSGLHHGGGGGGSGRRSVMPSLGGMGLGLGSHSSPALREYGGGSEGGWEDEGEGAALLQTIHEGGEVEAGAGGGGGWGGQGEGAALGLRTLIETTSAR